MKLKMNERKFKIGDEILKKENHCCICKGKDNLEPHHIFHTNEYDELYNSMENIVVMCHKCHHEYHQKYNYDLSFKTLLKFSRDYWMQYCPKLKTKNNKLRKENELFKKTINNLTKKKE
jgi:hypothetical protein